MRYRPSRRLIVAALVAVGLAIALTILPEIVRRLAVNRLGGLVTVPVSIADVDLNLFTGRARVENLRVGDPENPILQLPAFSARFSRAALLTGRMDLQEVILQAPALTIERTEAYRYNIAILRPRADKPNAEMPELSIGRLEIRDGSVALIDRTREPDQRLNLVSFELTAGPISTVTQGDAPPTGFNAAFKIGDGSVAIAGNTRALARSISVELNADLSGIELETFHAYLPYGPSLHVEDSRLNGHARYFLSSQEGKTAEHSLTGNLAIGGFALLSDADALPIVAVSGAQARDVRVDFLANETSVGSLLLENPDLHLERDARGWNVKRLFVDREAASPVQPPPRDQRDGRSMALTVERLEAAHGKIELIDRTADPAVAGSFRNAAVVAKNVAVLPRFAVPEIAMSAGVEEGAVQLAGAFQSEPFEGQFTIAGEGIPFESFGGYLNKLLGRVRWGGDTLGGNLKLALATGENDQVSAEISGSISGEGMSLRFPNEDNGFLSARHVGVDIRSLRTGEDRNIDIDRIQLSGADLRVVRRQNGMLNLSRLWSATEEAPRDKNGENKNSRVTPVRIRRISADQSAVVIHDARISPEYSTRLSGVMLQIANLSREADRATVDLKGVLLDGSANLALTGWFSAFSEPLMHLEGTIKGYELPRLNPYAMEYVNHRIESGQISTEVTYNFKAGKFEADANVVLEDVGVGERTGDAFDQRIGIPLELAVALLQDINGVIRLRLQFSGDRGPQISIADLVWNAVRNAIVSAITAPFRLIGNVLTLGGRIGGFQIEPILFEPGTLELQAQSIERLDAIGKVLGDKPRIELRLNGNLASSDIDALKQKLFWQRIGAAKGKNYQEALVDLYKNLGGVTEPAPPLSPEVEASLERFVTERVEIPSEQITQLVQSRAELVRQELVKRGVDPKRLLTTAQTELAADAAPRVSIELTS